MVVVFHMTPGHTCEMRQWDKFHLLADWLVEKYDARIALIGGRGDEEYNSSVIAGMNVCTRLCVRDTAGTLSFDELGKMLHICDLFVCINSFPMHLGVCLEVPMVAIVGATDPSVILPPHVPRLYSEYAKDIPLQNVIDKIEEILK